MRATFLFLCVLVTTITNAQNISKYLTINGNRLYFDSTKTGTFVPLATEGWVIGYLATHGGGGGGIDSVYTSNNGITPNGNIFQLGGALVQNTTLTGVFNLNFGAIGSRLSQLNVYTSNGILLQDGPVSGTFPYLQLVTGNATLYGRTTSITGLNGLSLTSGGNNTINGATVEVSAVDSLKFTGTIPTSIDTTAKPLWLTANGKAVKGNHGNWVTSVFGRTGAVTAQTGDYAAFYPILAGSYSNPSWITGLAYSKIIWSGTSSQYPLGDGTLATKITNNNQLTNGAGYITNITGKISQGVNVSITGSGTSADPYVINSSGGTGSTYSFLNGLTETGGVAKWGGRLTANTSVSGANLYQIAFDSVTKLGVGTASPNAKLHVNGVAGSNIQGFEVGLQITQPNDGSQAINISNGTNASVNTNMYLGNGGDFWIENHDIISGNNIEVEWNAPSNQFVIHTEDDGYIGLDANNSGYVHIQGRLGMKTVDPTAIVHLPAGTATAGTAPLKFTTGIPLTTPEDGVVEYHTGHLYFTIGSTRYQLDQQSGGGGSVGTWQAVTDNGNTSTNILIANGTLGSGTVYDNTPYSTNPLMLWYPRKGAFRAGRSSIFWRTDSIGNYSAAFGQNTKAKGTYSFASGDGPIAKGVASVAFGRTTFANGDFSFVAGGSNSIAAGTGAVAAGTDGEANGNYSFIANDANYVYGESSSAFGFGNFVYSTRGFAAGNDNAVGSASTGSGTPDQYVDGIALGVSNRITANYGITIGYLMSVTASKGIVIGSGTTSQRLVNSEANSVAIGNNSTVPSFVVHAASGAGTYALTEAYGAFKLGTTSTLSNGTVRYTGTDFEGAVGGSWLSLTTPTQAQLPTNIVYNNQANSFNNNTIEGYSAKYNDQTGTTYTLLSSDNGKILTFSNASAITVTIPSGLPIGFNCMVVQKGAAQITLTTSSTTLNSYPATYNKTAGQWAVATLISNASNQFILGGAITN